MLKIIFIIISCFTSLNIRTNVKKDLVTDIQNEKANYENPFEDYALEIQNEQNVIKQGHLLSSNFDYAFKLNLKLFNKYSLNNFSFCFDFEMSQTFIDKNNNKINEKNNVSFNFVELNTQKDFLREHLFNELNSNETVNFATSITTELEKDQDYQLAVLISNTQSKNTKLKDKKYFKFRSFEFTKLRITLIPKINFEILERQKLYIEYNPTNKTILVEDLNNKLKKEVDNLLENINISKNSFYYFFNDLKINNQNINNLSSINSELTYGLKLKFAKSDVIEKDTFLKKLYIPYINVCFTQSFNIEDIGLKSNIYLNESLVVSKELLINEFGVYSFMFNSILKLNQMDNELYWKISVNNNYNSQVFGEIIVKIIKTTNNWTEEEKEEVNKEKPDPVEPEVDEGEEVTKLKSEKKSYLKSIILFCCSMLLFSSILLPELFKKLKKCFWKNDKI
ncbi:hypothetical protein [Mesoplasma chauliocola]|nr:hypothetical protein [Mesoplasma chauliocola]